MTKPNRRGLRSRERILKAAAEMFAADPGAPLSVRAVAAAAGVSPGSLRYAFPTQRDLQDAVLAGLADVALSEDIGDRSTPARERLLRCLQDALSNIGVGDDARKAWSIVYHAFIEPEPTPEIRMAHRSTDHATRPRVERWLRVLHAEGALVDDDIARHTQFLCSVVNGVAFERALPSADSTLRAETETLRTAVAAVVRAA